MKYVEGMSLSTTRPQLRIAKHIFQEIIPRELTWIALTLHNFSLKSDTTIAR